MNGNDSKRNIDIERINTTDFTQTSGGPFDNFPNLQAQIIASHSVSQLSPMSVDIASIGNTNIQSVVSNSDIDREQLQLQNDMTMEQLTNMAIKLNSIQTDKGKGKENDNEKLKQLMSGQVVPVPSGSSNVDACVSSDHDHDHERVAGYGVAIPRETGDINIGENNHEEEEEEENIKKNNKTQNKSNKRKNINDLLDDDDEESDNSDLLYSTEVAANEIVIDNTPTSGDYRSGAQILTNIGRVQKNGNKRKNLNNNDSGYRLKSNHVSTEGVESPRQNVNKKFGDDMDNVNFSRNDNPSIYSQTAKDDDTKGRGRRGKGKGKATRTPRTKMALPQKTNN